MVVIRRKKIDEVAAAAKLAPLTRAVAKSVEIIGASPPEVAEAVATLALMIYNTCHSYWMSPSDYSATATDRFRVMANAFDKNAEVRFTVSHQSLMINGILADMDNRYIKFLADHLSALEISNFTVTRGLTVDEFKEMIQLLGKSPPQMAALGGFSNAVATGGFKNIQARKIVLKEVNESEVVVPKDAVDTSAIERKTQAESTLLAFLINDVPATTDESVECLRELAKAPGMIADIIVKAAESRTSGNQDEAARKGAIVHCFERFFDGLMTHSFARTIAGKKSVGKTMEELKKDLLEAVHAEPGDEMTKAIEGAAGQMVEGLEISGVAVDYARKLKALEVSEKRILRFMKAQGLEKLKQSALEEQLGESGLDVSGWQRLLAKSSIAGSLHAAGQETVSGGMEESSTAIANLAAILERLALEVVKPEADPSAASAEQLAGDVKDASDMVATLADGTEKKIHALVDAVTTEIGKIGVTEDVADKDAVSPKMSRRQMVVLLAEIVQEICQPLAVIKCSLEMVQMERLGQVTSAQKNMLDLAAQGILRIGALAKSLERISGMPTDLEPNSVIQESLYRQAPVD
jgi:hypothetical protein